MNKLPTTALFGLVGAACWGPATAAPPAEIEYFPGAICVAEIRFVGNEVTSERILRNELHFDSGDEIRSELLGKSRQSIMDLGLFESVDAAVSEASEGDCSDIEFSIEEKRYWLVLPRGGFNRQRELSYGFKASWENIAGLNQKASLVVQRKELRGETGGNQDRFRFSYGYPAVSGTRQDVGARLEHSRGPVKLDIGRDVDDDGINDELDYEERAAIVEATVSHRFADRGQTSGLRAGMGFGLWLLQRRPLAGSPELDDGTAAYAVLFAGYRDITFKLHSEVGYDLSYRLETDLGGEFDYTRQDFSLRYFHPGFSGPHHNLVFLFDFGLVNGGPEALEPFDIARSVRGFEKGKIEGGASWSLGVEYLAPLFGVNSLRGYIFTDVGNVYRNRSEFDLLSVRSAVGLGIRWRPKQFVGLIIDLGVAYAFEEDGYRAEFGIERVN